VPIVLKSGSLNLLEPLGPVQACNGIVLPLPYAVGGEKQLLSLTLGFARFMKQSSDSSPFSITNTDCSFGVSENNKKAKTEMSFESYQVL